MFPFLAFRHPGYRPIGLAEPLPRTSRGLASKRDGARNDQLQFGTCSYAAAQLKIGADRLGALPHPRQPPMTVPPSSQNKGIDSAAIVANRDPELPPRIFYFDFNVCCLGMQKGINHCLTRNPVNIVADRWMQRLRASVNDHPVT